MNKDLRDTERVSKLAHICMDAWQKFKNFTWCRKFDETNSEKTGQKFFSDEETAFLGKRFWRLLYPYRNDLISYWLYNKCRKTSWTSIEFFLRFVILGNTRRKKLTFFSLEGLPFCLFFFKILRFQQLITSLRIDVFTCTKFAWILRGEW